ncbi:MAG: arsenite efflux transporter metallochaperone ArsD [Paracoccaceae bacterium]
MTTLTVYDPAMCCSTGICGAEIDQRLVDMAADLDWLKAQGVTVQRFGLSREPVEFAANDTIRQIMQDSEGDDLPVFLVDGTLKAKARYPARAELAEWVGVTGAPGAAAQPSSACCGPTSEKSNAASDCCGGAAKSAPSSEKAGTCC